MTGLVRCVQCLTDVSEISAEGICTQCSLQTVDDKLARPQATGDWQATETNANQTTGYVPPGDITLPSFGNYELLGELGRGGMGVVYRAKQKRAERIVALKLIRGGSADEGARHRFMAEARALARISHPHIVAVYEVGEENDCPFFTMEFIDGGTLLQRLKSGSPLSETEAARLIEELAGAVQAAHAVGVLHRDIKPGNVLIGQTGVAKLTDFGLAKHLNDDSGITVAGSALGTPSYMSPEQASGKVDDLGPATDVYSLGATLYELLTGRPPFRGANAGATLSQVLNQEVVPPGKLRKGLSRELEAICLKCLEKNPADRYVSAAGLADDLTRWRSGLSTIARPLSRIRRTWRYCKRRPLVSALVLLTLFSIPAAFLALRERDPEVTIPRQLQSGRAVTLIGPTGPPLQARWLIGTPPPGTPDPKRPFILQTDQSCYVELLSDPGIDRYRFSLEIRHSGVGRFPGVGFYFGRFEIGPVDDPATGMFSVSHNDVRNEKEHRSNQQYFISTDLIYRTECVHTTDMGRIPKINPLVSPGAGPWRKFAVEVTPERIDILFPDESGAMVSRRRFEPEDKTMKKSNFFLARALARSFPQGGVSGDHYRIRGGLGLMVGHATAEFRNAVLEPLPVPTIGG